MIHSLSLARVNFLGKLETANFARIKLVRKLSYELSTEIWVPKNWYFFWRHKNVCVSCEVCATRNYTEKCKERTVLWLRNPLWVSKMGDWQRIFGHTIIRDSGQILSNSREFTGGSFAIKLLFLRFNDQKTPPFFILSSFMLRMGLFICIIISVKQWAQFLFRTHRNLRHAGAACHKYAFKLSQWIAHNRAARHNVTFQLRYLWNC